MNESAAFNAQPSRMETSTWTNERRESIEMFHVQNGFWWPFWLPKNSGRLNEMWPD